MQSVTSNAVAEALYNAETYTAISGLTLYKIGRIVYGQLYKAFSGSSPITVGVLPAKWRPIKDCRVCFMNNASDTPKGQFIVYNVDGAIRLYQEGGGGTLSYTVVVSFSYFTET